MSGALIGCVMPKEGHSYTLGPSLEIRTMAAIHTYVDRDDF